MPTYEYRCPAGHVFERSFPTMNARRREKCPSCGKQAERLISGGVGLVFKGSGFYATDYKRTGDKGDKKEDKSDHGESKTPESKPADSPKKKKPSGEK